MEPWLKVSCILCVFGFVRELRPSEPYHTEFLLGDTFNVTQDQLNRDVYPIATYSYLALLIVVFLVTDFLRYKPVIIANAITGTFIWGLLLFCSTVWSLQIVEVFYGFYQAAEVAYYSYIYAKVDKKYYPIVTSHTRAAMFAGKLVAGLSAQALIMWKLMNYRGLVYISMACKIVPNGVLVLDITKCLSFHSAQVLAMCWAFFLPRVQLSLYFHQKTPQASNELQGHVNMAVSETTAPSEASLSKGSESTAKSSIQPLQLLWLHFRSAYTNPMVVQWSLWYAVALAGYLQATSYIQVLWKSFENEPSVRINSKTVYDRLEWGCGRCLYRPGRRFRFNGGLSSCRSLEIENQPYSSGGICVTGRRLHIVGLLAQEHISLVCGLHALWRPLWIHHHRR
ncbi:folate transporter 1-like isoform X3 [Scaptodrosophila lebanonensis]|uniref:Folate transporter 1-like isoform X3 n=1 Tax=Drosophila lebanonensis TaxID=7225 RepID=A0A6J2TIF3_DROLE|nr:folate transporter 1-like isoform X3 [Scaptodrosophila lebanonensis]